MSKISKITVREKKLAKGKLHLYLDFYPAIKHPVTGKNTRRKFLGIYILANPKTKQEKRMNSESKTKADIIRGECISMLYHNDYSFLGETKDNMDFLNYFMKIVNSHKDKNINSYINWRSAYQHLHHFTKGKLNINQVNRQFVMDYKDYLLKAKTLKFIESKDLGQNTKHIYFNKFRTAIKKAYDSDLFDKNPLRGIKCIKTQETAIEFLTLNELQILKNTPLEKKRLKDACLFTAYTGLRYSDIERLTWANIRYSEEYGNHVRLIQKKTKNPNIIPFREEVMIFLGERKQDNDLIFGKVGTTKKNTIIAKWVLGAGINKHITYHCFRHTFSSLLLNQDIGLYTVSKMLGHKNVKTTQRYAHIVNKQKTKAGNAIPALT